MIQCILPFGQNFSLIWNSYCNYWRKKSNQFSSKWIKLNSTDKIKAIKWHSRFIFRQKSIVSYRNKLRKKTLICTIQRPETIANQKCTRHRLSMIFTRFDYQENELKRIITPSNKTQRSMTAAKKKNVSHMIMIARYYR